MRVPDRQLIRKFLSAALALAVMMDSIPVCAFPSEMGEAAEASKSAIPSVYLSNMGAMATFPSANYSTTLIPEMADVDLPILQDLVTHPDRPVLASQSVPRRTRFQTLLNVPRQLSNNLVVPAHVFLGFLHNVLRPNRDQAEALRNAWEAGLARQDTMVADILPEDMRMPWEQESSPTKRRADKPEDADPERQRIIKQWGKIVEEPAGPGLHQVVKEIFDRLSVAQQRRMPQDALSLNRVYVVDSPTIHAQVTMTKIVGVRRIANNVYVTTAMLRRMLTDGKGGMDPEGKDLLAGALTHELAHALDIMDSEGTSRHHGHAIGGQAAEVRADTEGSRIAEEAGYPRDVVYRALRRLSDLDMESSLLDAAAATHPESGMRSSMQEMFLGLERSQRGLHREASAGAADPSLLAELDAIENNRPKGRWEFDRPRTPAEAVTRLEELRSSDETQNYLEVESSRLLLTFDKLLEAKGNNLDEEDFDALQRLAGLFNSNARLMNREKLHETFTEENKSLEFLAPLAYSSHIRAVQRIPAYRHPRHVEWARAYHQSMLPLPKERKTLFTVFPRFLPWDIFAELFEEHIVAATLADLRHADFSLLHEYQDAINISEASTELLVWRAWIYHSRIAPLLSEVERIAMLAGDMTFSGRHFYELPQRTFGKEPATPGILSDRMELFGNPRLHALQKRFRQIARAIWHKRGYYATLEFASLAGPIDWDTIFAVLGIDPNVGYSKIRQAVKAFTQNPGYANMLRCIGDSSHVAVASMKRGKNRVRIEWADATLAAFLSGERNGIVQAEAALQAAARSFFVIRFYFDHPNVLASRYAMKLACALVGEPVGPLPLEWFVSAHQKVFTDLFGRDGVDGSDHDILHFLYERQAQAIAASPLTDDEKRDLLRALFLKGFKRPGVEGLPNGNEPGQWLAASKVTDEQIRSVLSVLAQFGVAADVPDFLAALAGDKRYASVQRKGGWAVYFGTVRRLVQDILVALSHRLESVGPQEFMADVLLHVCSSVLNPDPDHKYADAVNIGSLRDFKRRVVEMAANLFWAPPQALLFHSALTATGPTMETDDFFLARVAARYDGALSRRKRRELETILGEHRLLSSNLQLRLAARLLRREVLRLSRLEADNIELHQLIERLNRYVPKGSLRKDRYLEHLAWRLRMSEVQTGALIEDEKSYNWRKIDPLIVRLGSALSSVIAGLTVRSRVRFILAVADPEHHELPREAFRVLEQNLRDAAMAAFKAHPFGSPDAYFKIPETARATALQIRLEFEAALADSSQFERIPLLKMLLSVGRDALVSDPLFPQNVIQDEALLNYPAGSQRELALSSFLSIVPAWEPTVDLTYLLSLGGRDKSDVSRLFQTFPPLSDKFGQVTATFQTFGPRVAARTQVLKSGKRGKLTKSEIQEVMRQELTPEEFERVHLNGIIASASFKTIVDVALEGWGDAAMVVFHPHVAEQVESVGRLASDWIGEMRRRGATLPTGLFDSLLEGTIELMGEEIDTTLEAEKIETARGIYAGLNRSMRRELGPWHFHVPGLVPDFEVHPHIYFMEKARGDFFENLEPALQGPVGKLIVVSSLRTLFRLGWSDGDRHRRNQLIDVAGTAIRLLDFGQARYFQRGWFWQADDLYALAQFLRALDEKNSSALLHHALAMAKSGSSLDDSRLILRRVDKILESDRTMANQIIAVGNLLADRGAPLAHRFSVGALKQLLYLQGEGYVPQGEFRALLSAEIEHLLRRKLPAYLNGANSSFTSKHLEVPLKQI